MRSLFWLLLFFCSSLTEGQTVCDTTVQYQQNLQEVVVKSNYIRQTVNGNIELRLHNNPLVKGNNSIDVLNFIPGVEATDEGVLINKRPQTLIYIGERKISPKELSTISPSMIRKIVVTPQAETFYGNEASGGIIHIILREEAGLLGSVSLKGQADWDGLVDGMLSGSLLLRKGKNSFYNSLYTGKGVYRIKHHQTNYSLSTIEETMMDRRKDDCGILDNIGFTHNFSSQKYINIYGGMWHNKTKTDQNSQSAGNTLGLFTKLTKRNFNIGGETGWSFGKKGQGKLMAKVEYTYNKESQNQLYQLDTQEEVPMLQRLQYISANLRLSHQFGAFHAINAGLASINFNDDNERKGLSSEILYQVRDQDFELVGKDISPWFEYTRLIGKKMFILAGIRYYAGDMTYSDRKDGNEYTISYHGFYPNLQCQYMISQEHNRFLSFSYRYMYSIPNYGYFNPIAQYTSSSFYTVGNTDLDKETFHKTELSFNINKDWTLTQQNSFGNQIVQIMTNEDPQRAGCYYTKPENAGKSFYSSFMIKWNKKITGWWYSNNSLSYAYLHESMPIQNLNNTEISISSSNQLTINKHLGATIRFSYYTKEKHLGYRKDPSYKMDVSVYYNILKESLMIKGQIVNLLRNTDVLHMGGNDYSIVREDISRNTRISLTLTWNFNAGKKIDSAKMRTVNSVNREDPSL